MFLEQLSESTAKLPNGILIQEERTGSKLEGESISEGVNNALERCDSLDDTFLEKETEIKDSKTHAIQIWSRIRPSLRAIEHMMSVRVKKKNKQSGNDHDTTKKTSYLDTIEELRHSKGSEDDSEDEFFDIEKTDPVQESQSESGSADLSSPLEQHFSWKEELECLVRGGVPMALRGEVVLHINFTFTLLFLGPSFSYIIESLQLWQAFVGVGARRVEGYYHELLSGENNGLSERSLTNNSSGNGNNSLGCCPEKWTGQIEKVRFYVTVLSLSLSVCENDEKKVFFVLFRIYLEHSLDILRWMKVVEMH